MNTRLVAAVGLGLVTAFVVAAQELPDRPASSWPAPPYWLPAGLVPAAGAESAEAAPEAVEPTVVRALPLVAVPPCRLLDTRGEGLAALSAGVGQEVAVVGRCGIPAQAQGVSVRLVVAERSGGGQVIVGAAGENGGGAGRLVLDLGATGVTTGVVGLDGSARLLATAEGGSTHVVVEVNGYYAAEPAVRSLNAVAGDVTLEAGENVEITTEGSVVTIAIGKGRGGTDERPGEPEPPVPGTHEPVRHLVQVPAGHSTRTLPPVKAMAPPSSSMYLGGALGLPDTTALGAGVLTVGGDRFLHNYGPASDAGNTFLGESAGNFTMGGTGSQGKYNTGLGSGALAANTTGYKNTASGSFSLYANTTGVHNTASGFNSLRGNTTGEGNTASGALSLYSNTTGFDNTASGHGSLQANTTGVYNTASGSYSLYSNTRGRDNTASGAFSLYSNTWGDGNTANGSNSLSANTTGYENTASGTSSLSSNTTGYTNTASGVLSLSGNTAGYYNTASGVLSLSGNTEGYGNTASGHKAGDTNTTGSHNTFVGMSSDASANNLTNATAIGYQAVVNASNKVRIGNASVTVIEGQVNFTASSDVRDKADVRDLDAGLELIRALRPVAYRLKEGNGRSDWGFIAQEIEAVVGEGNNLVTVGPEPERKLGLRYADLIAPLVKAVQEQQAIIEVQQARIEALESREEERSALVVQLEAQQARIDRLERQLEIVMAAWPAPAAERFGN